MLCDICKKREAVIHYTEVVGNKVKKLNLCIECALVKGIDVQPPFPLGELFGGLMSSGFKSDIETNTVCPACGMTISDFRKTGKLGCGVCYKTFNKTLIPLLETIHKSSRHIGKVPGKEAKAKGRNLKIDRLNDKLRRAVNNEEYELAAKYRDEIRILEKNLTDNSSGKSKTKR